MALITRNMMWNGTAWQDEWKKDSSEVSHVPLTAKELISKWEKSHETKLQHQEFEILVGCTVTLNYTVYGAE